jgi:hypothetical protein
MTRVFLVATAVAGVLFASSTLAAELKSGPQVGDSVGVFNPEHLTGPNVGKNRCLV